MMSELWLALALMFQLNPGPAGMVTGQVLTPTRTPVSGLRVFAIPAATSDLASTPANVSVYESLVQTDASGKYQLPVPPGRYYIAAGSVNSPTYYPNATIVSSAKAIVVSANVTITNIDFSQYVPAAVGTITALPRGPTPLPGSTGVLEGIIRLPDGSPATRVPVVLAPASAVNSAAAGNSVRPTTLLIDLGPISALAALGPALASAAAARRISAQGGPLEIRTDNSGHYRFESVSPDTYIVMTGYSDNPAYYPGTKELRSATPITTTPATNLSNLDFSILPSQGTHTTVQGKVVTSQSRPATGVRVVLVPDGKATGAAALLSARENPRILTDGNGTYRFDDVAPGTYELQAELSTSWFSSKSMSVVVSDHPVTADFEFEVRVVSGRIVWDDGAPFGDVSQVAVSTTGNPSFIQTRLASVSGDGAFSMVMESGAYRLFVRDLPVQYTVTSITAGSINIANQPLSFSSDAPVDVVIRIAKKTGNSPRVTGRAVDGSGKPVGANRIVLCCIRSGPVEQISAALQSDGTFEFTELPVGSYTVELRNQSRSVSIGPDIEVGTSNFSNLTIVSTRGIGSVGAPLK